MNMMKNISTILTFFFAFAALPAAARGIKAAD